MPKRSRFIRGLPAPVTSQAKVASKLGQNLTAQALQQRDFHIQGIHSTTQQLQSLGHRVGKSVIGGVKLASHVALTEAILGALVAL